MKSVKVLTALCVLCGALAANAEPAKIRVGWSVPVTNVASIMFEKPGVARHLGQSYVYEPLRFANTVAMITALATGDIDVGTISNTALGIAIANADIDDMRIVADELRDGVGDYYSNQYMVLKDSPIRTIEDLKGRIIGVNTQGGAADLARIIVLRRHNLDVKRDMTMVDARLANMKAMLSDHKIDLGEATLPFAYDPGLLDIARPLFAQKDAGGSTDMLVWAARTPFLAKNRAAMVDFMEDSIRAVRVLLDPANHGEIVAMAARFTKQPESNFDAWLFTERDFYRDPNLMPDLNSLQRNFDLQAELSYVKRRVDAKQHADLSILEEALARVK